MHPLDTQSVCDPRVSANKMITTLLTPSFGNCLFAHHLVLKHLQQNVSLSSFYITKVVCEKAVPKGWCKESSRFAQIVTWRKCPQESLQTICDQSRRPIYDTSTKTFQSHLTCRISKIIICCSLRNLPYLMTFAQSEKQK